jgi:hypothetical protein
VGWPVIEDLIADTVDAERLPVARAGEDEWRPASEVLSERALPDAGADAAEDLPDDVMQPLKPAHGLGRWLSQGAAIVFSALWSFVVAQIAVAFVGSVTFRIGSAPLQAGMYRMALRRFRGREVGAGDVVEGFRLLVPAISVALITTGIPLAVVYAASFLGAHEMFGAFVSETAAHYIVMLSTLALLIPIEAAAFYAMPLIVDRGMSGWEAIRESWRKTRGRYWSYLCMSATLWLVRASGLLVVIGTLVTVPIALAATASAYVYHFDAQADAKGKRA